MKRYCNALVLGYGRSGKAAERMLQAEGCDTTVLARETASDNDLNRLLEREFDVCIVSPGFALSHPWMVSIRRAGIPLLSELELGWSRFNGKTVAVTGSNGKSTAVKWIHETLGEAGLKSAIGGNYGIPACEAVLEHPDAEWLVLEVSSFQLETVRDFSPDIAIILNILPNHLDRHGSMEAYRQAKARIFGPAGAKGTAIVPGNLLEILRAEVPVERTWLSFGAEKGADYRFEVGKVLKEGEIVLDLAGTGFDSPIIGACTGAAVAAFIDTADLPSGVAETAARRFKPLPHRLQKIGELDGVAYVNDSKATNLAAMAAALQSTGSNIHLIAGGLPKESDYTFVKEMLAERVRSIYVIGQASRAMYEAWNGVCPCVECGTLDKAFETAQKAARAGDTILLSPGCASFDQFSCFEERGERFEKLFHGAGNAWI